MSLQSISHSRNEETPEAKVIWFRSLTIEERIEYLDFITDMALENNPDMMKKKHVEPISGRILVLTAP